MATSQVESPRPRGIVAAAIVSMAGHVVHTPAEFPPAIRLAAGTVLRVAVTVILAAALLRRPTGLAWLATAAWATVVLVVGGGSVLPLPSSPSSPTRRSATTRYTWRTRWPSCRCC